MPDDTTIKIKLNSFTFNIYVFNPVIIVFISRVGTEISKPKLFYTMEVIRFAVNLCIAVLH